MVMEALQDIGSPVLYSVFTHPVLVEAVMNLSAKYSRNHSIDSVVDQHR